MHKVNWTTVVVFSIVVLLAFIVGASLLGRWGHGGWGYGGWGMMGPWMMGGMFFMWLFPIAFIVLIVFGIAWLVRTIGGGTNPPVPAHPCPSCGRGVQADWKNCPHCGAVLVK
ncbi:MAG: zinc ribbon domain-containing protein [Chloroflexi bacterium]|nr:zinc ribbon domain-containing protein [Chloroflexota bacterium]